MHDATRRRLIADVLRKRKYTARKLANTFEEQYKIIVNDLFYISKSVLPKEKLVRTHAVCNTCGFVFKDRLKQHTPTKCPKCKGEDMTHPTFHIE